MPSRNREHPLPKLPVDPQRIRSMPRQFGAIDRNLVYRDHLHQMSSAEIALYTFLICVSDPQGLSYYSDRRLCHDLHLTTDELLRARQALIARQFILYRPPIYQLLDLPLGGEQRMDGAESSLIALAKARPARPGPTRRSSPSQEAVPIGLSSVPCSEIMHERQPACRVVPGVQLRPRRKLPSHR